MIICWSRDNLWHEDCLLSVYSCLVIGCSSGDKLSFRIFCWLVPFFLLNWGIWVTSLNNFVKIYIHISPRLTWLNNLTLIIDKWLYWSSVKLIRTMSSKNNTKFYLIVFIIFYFLIIIFFFLKEEKIFLKFPIWFEYQKAKFSTFNLWDDFEL